jgi:galactitol-specific phosphotransferase system IIB component
MENSTTESEFIEPAYDIVNNDTIIDAKIEETETGIIPTAEEPETSIETSSEYIDRMYREQFEEVKDRFEKGYINMDPAVQKSYKANLSKEGTKNTNHIKALRAVQIGTSILKKDWDDQIEPILSSYRFKFKPVIIQLDVPVPGEKFKTESKDFIVITNNLKDEFNRNGKKTLAIVKNLQSFGGYDEAYSQELKRVEININSGNVGTQISTAFDRTHTAINATADKKATNQYQLGMNRMTQLINDLVVSKNIIDGKLKMCKRIDLQLKEADLIKKGNELDQKMVEVHKLTKKSSLDNIFEKYVLGNPR